MRILGLKFGQNGLILRSKSGKVYPVGDDLLYMTDKELEIFNLGAEFDDLGDLEKRLAIGFANLMKGTAGAERFVFVVLRMDGWTHSIQMQGFDVDKFLDLQMRIMWAALMHVDRSPISCPEQALARMWVAPSPHGSDAFVWLPKNGHEGLVKAFEENPEEVLRFYGEAEPKVTN